MLSFLSKKTPPPQKASPLFKRELDKRIFTYLSEHKILAEDKLSVAKQFQESHMGPYLFIEALRELHFIDQGDFKKFLKECSVHPFYDLSKHDVIDASLENTSFESCFQCQALPLTSGKTVKIVMADCEDIVHKDRITKTFPGKAIKFYQGDPKLIQKLLTQKQLDENTFQSNGKTKFITDLINQAIHLKASDIHFQPREHFVDIKLRMDGILTPFQTINNDLWESLAIQLKILGNLDIAETRKPQNGRFSMKVAGSNVDFRLSVHPTINGENVVIRILDKFQSLIRPENLGFNPNQLDYLKEIIQQPQGLIILCGPTGSGKTTTLYSLLTTIDTTSRNTMTLEDPIEYLIPGVRQTNVSEQLGFADGIRSLLRQDPDIILIGEIRDEDTAQMAIRASLTGHLVLCTLHTTDTLNAPQRLIELGINPGLLAGNIISILSQRLVRKLCHHCKKDVKSKGTLTYSPIGCEECREGYKGREALIEILPITEKINHAIFNGADRFDLLTVASEEGFVSLQDSALEKIRSGITTIEEVQRVLGSMSMDKILS